MSILEDYWSGVLRRLQAEVDTFNRLIEHQGEKGRENELSLARLLGGLIPEKFGIGSGLLIDSVGNYSKQMDVIVYDRSDEPALMAQTNQVLFPVENVRACIEVKTTVGKEEIEDAHEKHASIKALRSHGSYPKFALVGYKADSHPATIATHLLSDPGNAMDLACVLQIALFASAPELTYSASAGKSILRIGVTAVLENDSEGKPTPGVAMAPPDGGAESHVIHNGHSHPVVTVPTGEVVGEPSRALLLFCESLLNALSRDGARSVLGYYLTEPGRDLIALD